MAIHKNNGLGYGASTMASTIGAKTALPRRNQKSRSLSGEQKPRSPIGEQKPRSPIGEQKPRSPIGEQKPMSRYFAGRALSWWMIVFYIFLYAPMLVLVIYSFNQNRLATVWTGFSFDWYLKLFSNEDILRTALNSTIVAFSAAPISVAFALAAAYVSVRGMDFLGKALVLVAVVLPLVIPEIVSAVATLIFFSTFKIDLGLGNVIIAHTVFCLPFAYVPLRAALMGMDPNLEMAARDLYASEWGIFRLVTLPLLRNAIFSAFALAFVISLDDFIITLMVAGAGAQTLPVYIYSMIRLGITPEVNAISSIYLIISVCLVSIYLYLSKNKSVM